MTNEKTVYVDLIDGTNTWVPAEVKQLDETNYIILAIEQFDENDPTQLLEFFPGDTVEVGEITFRDGEIGLVPKKLIKPSLHPSRKYFDFLYKVLQKKIPLDKTTYEAYKEEIERVKKEESAGQFFYPDILKNINEIEKVISTE